MSVVKKHARITAWAAAVAVIAPLSVTPSLLPVAAAAPTIPDTLPLFPQVQEDPRITVTTEDGRSVDGLTVHRGDILLVHGTGFSPMANQGGFPLPVPPGVPNGVYVLYSAFPENWKPSEGAPSVSRTHPHDRMAWVGPDVTFEAIPRSPINMHRSIARVAQPMADDGSFTARIEVDPPASTPGGNWGVYVYAGAGSVNAAEEIYVPIAYSSEPGHRTPPEPTPDLVFDASVVHRITGALGGGINPRFGAAKQSGERVSFSRDLSAENTAADGIRRYRGQVTATARFSVIEVAVKDPWIEPRADGSRVLTALVSQGHDVGADVMERRVIGALGDKDPSGRYPVLVGSVVAGMVELDSVGNGSGA